MKQENQNSQSGQQFLDTDINNIKIENSDLNMLGGLVLNQNGLSIENSAKMSESPPRVARTAKPSADMKKRPQWGGPTSPKRNLASPTNVRQSKSPMRKAGQGYSKANLNKLAGQKETMMQIIKEKHQKALDKIANPTGIRPFSPIGNVKIDLNTKSLSPARVQIKSGGKFVSRGNDIKPYLVKRENGRAVVSPSPRMVGKYSTAKKPSGVKIYKKEEAEPHKFIERNKTLAAQAW